MIAQRRALLLPVQNFLLTGFFLELVTSRVRRRGEGV